MFPTRMRLDDSSCHRSARSFLWNWQWRHGHWCCSSGAKLEATCLGHALLTKLRKFLIQISILFPKEKLRGIKSFLSSLLPLVQKPDRFNKPLKFTGSNAFRVSLKKGVLEIVIYGTSVLQPWYCIVYHDLPCHMHMHDSKCPTAVQKSLFQLLLVVHTRTCRDPVLLSMRV